MGFGGTVDYLVDTVFNYPTLAEALQGRRARRHQQAARDLDALRLGANLTQSEPGHNPARPPRPYLLHRRATLQGRLPRSGAQPPRTSPLRRPAMPLNPEVCAADHRGRALHADARPRTDSCRSGGPACRRVRRGRRNRSRRVGRAPRRSRARGSPSPPARRGLPSRPGCVSSAGSRPTRARFTSGP